MSLVSVGAACGVALLSSTITATDTGWLEQTEITISAHNNRCAQVVLPLPEAVTLGRHHARELLGDGIKRKLPDAAWSIGPRGLDGQAQVVVYLPDMRQGDQAMLSFERHWDRAEPFRWQPSPAGHAELDTALATTFEGAVKIDKKGPWISEATSADLIVIDAPGHTGWTPAFADLREPTQTPERARTLTLEVPPGQPQYTLYPGGGAVLHTRLDLSFAAEDHDRGWVVPIKPGAFDVQVNVRPSNDAAQWIVRDSDVLLVIAGSEGPAKVSVQWREPEAPTYGEATPGETLTVLAPGGKIVEDTHDTWFLAGIHDQPVIPARSALVRGLDRRYRNQAIPEPGLPNALRGQRASWQLAEQFVPQLADRLGLAHWPNDPLWVRRLIKAKKSGGLTAAEANLTVWVWAMQSQLPAQWVLVRPAATGPGGEVSPAGYTEMLVQVTWDNETRWIDAACTACAPFEVRPALLGSRAMAQDVSQTPPPPRGVWTAMDSEQWVRWDLDGPAALSLRLWLQQFPQEDQWPQLALRMAGAGAELVEAEGVEDLGAPIRVAARGGDRTGELPLHWVPDADGSVWFDWPGPRSWVQSDGVGTPLRVETDAYTLVRTVRDGALWTVLDVKHRRLSADDVAKIEAALAEVVPVVEEVSLEEELSLDQGFEAVDTAAQESAPRE